jgi:hypothetical protein
MNCKWWLEFLNERARFETSSWWFETLFQTADQHRT